MELEKGKTYLLEDIKSSATLKELIEIKVHEIDELTIEVTYPGRWGGYWYYLEGFKKRYKVVKEIIKK